MCMLICMLRYGCKIIHKEFLIRINISISFSSTIPRLKKSISDNNNNNTNNNVL